MSYIKKFDPDSGSPEKNKIVKGRLYLVSTPIGNLSDMSPRAVKTLGEVDFVAAEDTRNAGMLLERLGIEKKPMISYFEHNKRARGEVIVERLLEGEAGALVSDAGTPAISDPGEDIVRLCAEKGITVTAVPGCCAGINALVLSGLSTSRFSFEGFLSGSKSERREKLEELAREKRTLIIYEAPHKLTDTLADIYAFFGDRQIALCREMTKLNEEVRRFKLSEAIEYYKENMPRGEYVIVIEGASRHNDSLFWENLDVSDHIAYYEERGMTRSDAMKAAALDRGVSKSEIYKHTIKTEKR